jgi:hypothetical protein
MDAEGTLSELLASCTEMQRLWAGDVGSATVSPPPSSAPQH